MRVPDWTDHEIAERLAYLGSSQVQPMFVDPKSGHTDAAIFTTRMAEIMLMAAIREHSGLSFLLLVPFAYTGVLNLMVAMFGLGVVALRDGWFREHGVAHPEVPVTTLN